MPNHIHGIVIINDMVRATHASPLRQIQLSLDTDVLLADVEITFVPVDGNQTEITAFNKVVGKNLFWKSLLPLFKSTITEKSQAQYDKLKTMIEATPIQQEAVAADQAS